MSKKKRQTRQKIARTMVSVFVLGAIIIPMGLTAIWLRSLFTDQDLRKVVAVAQFSKRSIDDVAQAPSVFDEPLLSVAFDDGRESVYTNALPILQHDGIPTTQYIIAGTFSDTLYMSVEQLKSLKKAGHDIAAHTLTHADLTALTEDELTKELAESKDILAKDFGPTRDFTSPYGAHNTHTLKAIGKIYRSQKNAEGDPAANELEAINVKDQFDPLNIKSYSVRKTTTLNNLRKLIKAAQDNKGWLVLTYHQVDSSGEVFSVTPETFEEQMLLLNLAKIRTATVGRVLDNLQTPKGRGL